MIPPESYCRGPGAYPIDAYSEFLPPPRLGWKPYGLGNPDPDLFSEGDPTGWRVSEYEEARELQPGLEQVARQVLKHVGHLLDGDPRTEIPKLDLRDNPYWPRQLADAGYLPHERLVVLLPLALSRTQDDKGRLRWTLFGCSEQGPAKPFWRSFSDTRKGEPSDGAGVAVRCRAPARDLPREGGGSRRDPQGRASASCPPASRCPRDARKANCPAGRSRS